jgi:hypothetical protein
MTPSQRQKTIIQDAFTKRVLHIFTALLKKEAIDKKKTFAECIGVNASHYNNIEQHVRNFPDNNEKREAAIHNLNKKYGVNPDYMRGKSQLQFTREPDKVARAVSQEAVAYNFRNKGEKSELIKSRDMYKNQAEVLEQFIQSLNLQEPLSEYLKKHKIDLTQPDTKPDKEAE